MLGEFSDRIQAEDVVKVLMKESLFGESIYELRERVAQLSATQEGECHSVAKVMPAQLLDLEVQLAKATMGEQTEEDILLKQTQFMQGVGLVYPDEEEEAFNDAISEWDVPMPMHAPASRGEGLRSVRPRLAPQPGLQQPSGGAGPSGVGASGQQAGDAGPSGVRAGEEPSEASLLANLLRVKDWQASWDVYTVEGLLMEKKVGAEQAMKPDLKGLGFRVQGLGV